MSFKASIVCAFALIEMISSQSVCNPINPNLYNGLANRFNGLNNLGLNNGLNTINNGLNNLNNGLNNLNNGLNNIGLTNCGGVASTGGGFPVSSSSSNAPTGVSVVSENAYEGPLTVGGNLPFLGTVALEGVLPTAGAGAVSYGCGNGAVGITEEGPIATGITANGPGINGPIGTGIAAGPYGTGPISQAGPTAGQLGFGAFGRSRFGLGAANCAI